MFVEENVGKSDNLEIVYKNATNITCKIVTFNVFVCRK